MKMTPDQIAALARETVDAMPPLNERSLERIALLMGAIEAHPPRRGPTRAGGAKGVVWQGES